MSAKALHDARCAALDAYLDERLGDGFLVESRTSVQAIIVRQHRLSPLRWLGRRRAQQRLVVSVDQDGAVTSIAAEPRRW